MKQGGKRFCHFWNNGRCRYKDTECRFLHEESPECRYGKECNMRRCMFYHSQKENFSMLYRSGKGISSWREEDSGNW